MLPSTTTPNPVPARGTWVRYHGSITAAHGASLILGDCQCGPCVRQIIDTGNPSGYAILHSPAMGSRNLHHVRRQSYSVAIADHPTT